MNNFVTVKELYEDLKLIVLSCRNNLDNKKIYSEMIDRPGIEFLGFFNYFSDRRLLLIGSKEYAFLSAFSESEQLDKLSELLRNNPPAVVFSKNVDVPKAYLEISKKHLVPFLQSDLESTPLIGLLNTYLHRHLTSVVTYHGVLVDIHGVGAMITGPSGIGKSEIALELIKRGHTLVSDDRIDLKEISYGNVIGTTPKLLRGLIEVRGVGIIDVVRMFGSASYKDETKLDLIIVLEPMQKNKNYDRMGLTVEHEKIFNSFIPKITVPVSPGRSIASLVETAAMNQKLKNLGYNAAEDLVKNLEKEIKKKGDKQ